MNGAKAIPEPANVLSPDGAVHELMGDLLTNAIKVNICENVERLKTAAPILSQTVAENKVSVKQSRKAPRSYGPVRAQSWIEIRSN
jgi:hypothetical protein